MCHYRKAWSFFTVRPLFIVCLCEWVCVSISFIMILHVQMLPHANTHPQARWLSFSLSLSLSLFLSLSLSLPLFLSLSHTHTLSHSLFPRTSHLLLCRPNKKHPRPNKKSRSIRLFWSFSKLYSNPWNFFWQPWLNISEICSIKIDSLG